MTAVRTPDLAVPSTEPPAGPSPRRVRPPRWLDLRLVLGVLLVLGSVLLGSRVVASADAYLSTSTRPEGRTLSRSLRSGELLPRAALEEASELVQLALPVQSGYVPPGLERGQVVDVYAVADPAAGATGVADGSVTPVVRGATVQAVSGRSDGVLSTPTTAIQVVVAVGADDAPAVLGAIAGRPLVVVVHDSADGGAGAAGRAPAAGPTG